MKTYALRFKFIFGLIVLGLIVYTNILFNNFVWDDFDQVVRNNSVHSITNIGYFFSGSTFYSGGGDRLIGLYYKPLMPIFFAAIYSLFGPDARFFHLVQLLFHISNAVLLFLLFTRFFNNRLAFFASALFLVHPVNSETVSYISALQDVLFFFFGILALLLTMSARWKPYLLALLPFILLSSLLSKETGFLYLLITIVFVSIFNKKHLWQILICSGIAVFVYSVLRFGIAKVFYHPTGIAPILHLEFDERLLTMPKIFFYYLKTLVLPKDLAIAQHWVVTKISFGDFYLPLIISILFLFFIINTIFMLRKRKEKSLIFLFFVIWFTLGMGLNSNIIPLDMTVADRWFYFPFVGFLGLATTLISCIEIKNPQVKLNLLVFFMLILTALSLRTIIRTFDWRDIMTLYSNDIKTNQDSFDLQNNEIRHRKKAF